MTGRSDIPALLEQARKVARYTRIYGPLRTFAKVQAQRHATRHFGTLPRSRRHRLSNRHVAFIGCGKFAYSTLAYYLRQHHGAVIRAAMDVDLDRAASLFEDYDLDYYTDDANEIFADPGIDLVFIASNHASHASYAVRALEAGKSVHIEKPHVTTLEQLQQLCVAMRSSSGHVNLGFNRPNSPFAAEVRAALSTQRGSTMFNWFVAGHEIAVDHWYNRAEEGGRVFGNLCHWTDFLYQMVPRRDRHPIALSGRHGPDSDTDVVLSLAFADGSLGIITFCAKGVPFEGVRERLSLQRGDLLVALDDFERMTLEQGSRKHSMWLPFRDHGHEATVLRSYQLVRPTGRLSAPYSIAEVWETGELFLRAKEVIEQGVTVTLAPFDPSRV